MPSASVGNLRKIAEQCGMMRKKMEMRRRKRIEREPYLIAAKRFAARTQAAC